MLILTRHEGESIQIGDNLTVIVSKITHARVRVDLAQNGGPPVETGDIRLGNGAFVRRHMQYGQTLRIGQHITLTICSKRCRANEARIGITAPPEVVILRSELLTRGGQPRTLGVAA